MEVNYNHKKNNHKNKTTLTEQTNKTRNKKERAHSLQRTHRIKCARARTRLVLIGAANGTSVAGKES